jgi:hypothetical protein
MDQNYVGKSKLIGSNADTWTAIYIPSAVGTLPKRASAGTLVNYTYEFPSQSVIQSNTIPLLLQKDFC